MCLLPLVATRTDTSTLYVHFYLFTYTSSRSYASTLCYLQSRLYIVLRWCVYVFYVQCSFSSNVYALAYAYVYIYIMILICSSIVICLCVHIVCKVSVFARISIVLCILSRYVHMCMSRCMILHVYVYLLYMLRFMFTSTSRLNCFLLCVRWYVHVQLTIILIRILYN